MNGTIHNAGLPNRQAACGAHGTCFGRQCFCDPVRAVIWLTLPAAWKPYFGQWLNHACGHGMHQADIYSDTRARTRTVTLMPVYLACRHLNTPHCIACACACACLLSGVHVQGYGGDTCSDADPSYSVEQRPCILDPRDDQGSQTKDKGGTRDDCMTYKVGCSAGTMALRFVHACI